MKPALKKTFVALFAFFILGCSSLILGAAAIYLYLSPNLPSVESIRDVRLQTPLRVYSADGKLIGEFGEKRRRPVKIEDVPQPFIDALLAAEDFEFYSHRGVSIKGLARAVTELIATGRRGSGGSTLTMQLTRNVFLSLERKFIRKFNEILLSLKLERELSKDEILELYVNYMFLGKRAYGIQAAAEVYYGKDLQELSLAQLAMIAGLFQGPSTQNPIINPTRAIQRRNWILRRMHKLELIDQDTFDAAFKEPLVARYHGSQLDAKAPYVAELAREKAIRSFGLKAYTEGYRVITTVDSELQLQAQKAVINGILAYDKRHGYRGAEQNLGELPSVTVSITATATATAKPENKDNVGSADNIANTESSENIEKTESDIDFSSWLSILEDIPSYANLEPAAVVEVEDTRAKLLLKSGELAYLKWDDGLSSARPYVNEDVLGAKPQSASEVLSTGDVIRVVLSDEGRWTLSQLPDVQAALVALNPNNGAIRSIVGGFDFYQNQFNRATQAYRQPGSSLKPFLYAAALEQGMTPATLINDAPIVLQDAGIEDTWRPKNDGDKFYGELRLRKALYLSVNLVSIRILQDTGIGNTRRTMQRFGFDSERLPRDLSLALGNSSVTPLELATAWAAFANGGYKVGAHLIQRVYDNDNTIVYESFPDSVCGDCESTENDATEMTKTSTETFPSSQLGEIGEEPEIDDTSFSTTAFELPVDLKRALGWLNPEDYPKAPKIMDDRVAFLMDSILKDVVKRGTGRKARELNRPDIAGKTGTTNGPIDVWFSGYNKDLITTAWVGFDQNTNLGNGEFGSTAALPIWIEYMQEALKTSKVEPRNQPPGIVTVRIDPETGKRASIGDPDAIFEYFRSELAPELDASIDLETNNSSLETITEGIF